MAKCFRISKSNRKFFHSNGLGLNRYLIFRELGSVRILRIGNIVAAPEDEDQKKSSRVNCRVPVVGQRFRRGGSVNPGIREAHR